MNRQDMETLLEEKGIRLTSNRILILKALSDAKNPISLADLESRLGYTMDKASIFRVLELFAQKEVVHVIDDGSRSQKYEICHGHGHHSIADQHVHFYCEICKETFCIESMKVPMVQLPEGFESQSVNYVVKGICPRCGKKMSNPLL